MAIPDNYIKRGVIPDKEGSYKFTRYTQNLKKILEQKDSKLTEFRCSDSFIRTIQGVYILENIKTEKRAVRRIKNQKFENFMREKERRFESGMKILTGRICELSDKTVFLFYSTGSYDFKTADSTTARTVIVYSTNNTAYIDILDKGFLSHSRTFNIAKSENHVRCDQVFQVTEDKLYILCQEDKDFLVHYSSIEVNLNDGAVAVLENCTNGYKDKLETVCN